MAQTGSTGSYPIQSNSYDQLVDLLNNLPDNTLNEINAKDVRDSVFTLWDRLDKVSIIAGSAASASATFINPNPTTVTVGGIPSGSTFPTVQTMQQMFDKLLYPYQAPLLSLTATPNQKEYGDALSTTLGWSYTKKSNPITGAVVNGGAPVGPPATSGTKTANGTYSTIAPIAVSTTNTFNMTVTDSLSNTTVTTATLTWMNKIRWGAVNLSAISPSNPNLTTNPEFAGNVGAAITNATINGLTGQLATTKAKVYTGINGGGNYLIFAWPTIFGGVPTFIVNNLPSTAFTRVKTNWAYTNSFGVVTNYEVWISNTLQNSPLLVEVK